MSTKSKFVAQDCEQCREPFTPYNSRTHRFCTRKCFHEFTRGKDHPLWRGNRRHERGSTWKTNAGVVRARGCVAIGCAVNTDIAGQKLSVDHIIPFRLAVIYCQTDGIDPNDVRNLTTLCRSCHTKKTRAERFLLAGNLDSFLHRMRELFPSRVLEPALTLWSIGRSKENLLPFESVPEFMESTGRGRAKKVPDVRTCVVCSESFLRVRGQFYKKRTCSDKCAYKLRHNVRGNKGTRKGEAHPLAKLTEATIRAIRNERDQGARIIFISKKYAIKYCYIQKILRKEIWAHVA